MTIRTYTSADCAQMAALFYDTVHTVNARDYSQKQLDAWATGNVDLAAWDRSFLAHYTLIAEEDGSILGFGDMDETGYLDRLYVHKDHQRRGVATALCDALEAHFPVDTLSTHASITARPFFEKRGYMVIREQQAECQGVFMTNYHMEKRLSPAASQKRPSPFKKKQLPPEQLRGRLSHLRCSLCPQVGGPILQLRKRGDLAFVPPQTALLRR